MKLEKLSALKKLFITIFAAFLLCHIFFSYYTPVVYPIAIKVENVEVKNNEIFFLFNKKNKIAEFKPELNIYILYISRIRYDFFGFSNALFWSSLDKVLVKVNVEEKIYDIELNIDKLWYSPKDLEALKIGTFKNFIYLKFNGNGFNVIYPSDTFSSP